MDNWVKTTARLPPLDRQFLGYDTNSGVVFAEVCKIGEDITFNGLDGFRFQLHNMTHWMEIPKNPE